MADVEPVPRIREIFLEDEGTYGCAEAALVALAERYGFPDAADSSPAMVLNGGVAYSGGMCGAITGASLAVGRLAGQRIADHRTAKSTARRLVQSVMADFEDEYGATDCRSLTGYDMTTDHEAFMTEGTWKVTCTRQIEFVFRRLESLADPEEWDRAVAALDAPA